MALTWWVVETIWALHQATHCCVPCLVLGPRVLWVPDWVFLHSGLPLEWQRWHLTTPVGWESLGIVLKNYQSFLPSLPSPFLLSRIPRLPLFFCPLSLFLSCQLPWLLAHLLVLTIENRVFNTIHSRTFSNRTWWCPVVGVLHRLAWQI